MTPASPERLRERRRATIGRPAFIDALAKAKHHFQEAREANLEFQKIMAEHVRRPFSDPQSFLKYGQNCFGEIGNK